MTPKQKRAIKRARVEMLRMSKEAATDQDACNLALELLIRTAGSMIGGAAGMHGLPVEEMSQAATRAAQAIQKEAAEAYAHYLALDRKHGGPMQ